MAPLQWLAAPLPGFPSYPGPHAVGTVDVELLVSQLNAAGCEAPPGSVPTVAFRIFYPCERPLKRTRPVRWIPTPQMNIFSAYTRLLGLGPAASGLFSYARTFPLHSLIIGEIRMVNFNRPC